MKTILFATLLLAASTLPCKAYERWTPTYVPYQPRACYVVVAPGYVPYYRSGYQPYVNQYNPPVFLQPTPLIQFWPSADRAVH
jgi:hypothetical protein